MGLGLEQSRDPPQDSLIYTIGGLKSRILGVVLFGSSRWSGLGLSFYQVRPCLYTLGPLGPKVGAMHILGAVGYGQVLENYTEHEVSDRVGCLGILYTRLHKPKLEHGCRMIYAGVPSFCGLRLEDGHVPTFWLPLIPGGSWGLATTSNWPYNFAHHRDNL